MNDQGLHQRMRISAGLAVVLAATLAISGLTVFGCGSAKAGFPSEPDAAVRHVASQLHDQHPEVLWEALPASYRQDISELVHGFAGKLDPDVYNKAFGLLAKVVNILKEKKGIILESSSVESILPDDRAAVDERWDSAVGLLETVVNSDLASLEKVQTVDIGAFLAETGAQLMKQAADASKMVEEDPYSSELQAKLSQVQVETVSIDGETAVLRVTVPDQPAEELKMVRIEDRWVPEEIATEWDKNMAEAREQLAQLDESKMAETKMQAMMVMGMAEAFLEQVESAQTSEELDQVLGGLIGSLLSHTQQAEDDEAMPGMTDMTDTTEMNETTEE